MTAPESPATLRRIPGTGDLVLIWNEATARWRRTPLQAAISSDDGQTWQVSGALETDPNKSFAYSSLIFSESDAIMSYWESGPDSGQLSSRFRSVPVSWFYDEW